MELVCLAAALLFGAKDFNTAFHTRLYLAVGNPGPDLETGLESNVTRLLDS